MRDLFRAFFFKLSRDLTFRITLIIGAGLSILMVVLFLAIDLLSGTSGHTMCTGNVLFGYSFSPTSNFGLAIPINLISFTVLEFSHGIIRNKIVAGNSKTKIYLSLFLTGLVFTLSLLFVYVGLNTLLGTIIGGFNQYGAAMIGTSTGMLTPDFIWKYFIACVLVYITITSFTVFAATLLRNIGPSIPIVIVLSMILGMVLPMMYQMIPSMRESLGDIPFYLNPLQIIGSPTMESDNVIGIGGTFALSNKHMIATTIANVLWTVVFAGFGTLIFVKRDVK